MWFDEFWLDWRRAQRTFVKASWCWAFEMFWAQVTIAGTLAFATLDERLREAEREAKEIAEQHQTALHWQRQERERTERAEAALAKMTEERDEQGRLKAALCQRVENLEHSGLRLHAALAKAREACRRDEESDAYQCAVCAQCMDNESGAPGSVCHPCAQEQLEAVRAALADTDPKEKP